MTPSTLAHFLIVLLTDYDLVNLAVAEVRCNSAVLSLRLNLMFFTFFSRVSYVL